MTSPVSKEIVNFYESFSVAEQSIVRNKGILFDYRIVSQPVKKSQRDHIIFSFRERLVRTLGRMLEEGGHSPEVLNTIVNLIKEGKWMSDDIIDEIIKGDRPNIVVVSGGFDPIHEGHIYLISEANSLASSKYDSVIVGLNSDEWLTRKKGFFFMNYNERFAIVKAIKGVSEVMSFNDSDDTAIDLLNKVKKQYINHNILFANGGDRRSSNIPENEIEEIEYHFGVGGDYKTNSSTDILKRYEDNVRRKVLNVFKANEY